jgi:hypothetical protein
MEHTTRMRPPFRGPAPAVGAVIAILVAIAIFILFYLVG